MAPRRANGALAALAFGAFVFAPAAAVAAPQATAALTIGAAGASPDDAKPVTLDASRAFWKETDFHLGFRGDVLFGRTSNASWGAGPYAELLTHAFDEVQFGGGASVLVPILDTFPLVASGGFYARKASDGFGLTPGLAGELFWGSRSFNYHASYVLSAGLLTELRYGLGPNRETSIVIAAQLDLVALSLPFVFLASAIHGSSHEADPVR